MSNALLVVAEGSEEMEAIITADLLVRAGIKVTIASVSGRQITCSRGIKLIADCDLDEVKEQQFQMIIMPGGLPGAKILGESQLLIEMLKMQNEANRWIAAICAAPALVLARHDFLMGVPATVYPGFEGDLPIYEERSVVKSDNIITSRGPGTAIEFALALVSVLAGEIQAKEVASQILL